MDFTNFPICFHGKQEVKLYGMCQLCFEKHILAPLEKRRQVLADELSYIQWELQMQNNRLKDLAHNYGKDFWCPKASCGFHSPKLEEIEEHFESEHANRYTPTREEVKEKRKEDALRYL